MSDPTAPGTPDATEPLTVADQHPVQTAPPAAHGRRHTRTILEVVGGVVAAGLIVLAGLGGFAVGHAAPDDHGWQSGPEAGGPMAPPGHHDDGDGPGHHDDGDGPGRHDDGDGPG